MWLAFTILFETVSFCQITARSQSVWVISTTYNSGSLQLKGTLMFGARLYVVYALALYETVR